MPRSRNKSKKLIQRVSLTLFFCLIWRLAFAADTTPPTGSIKINNGASSTNTIAVTLNLSATDTGSGVSEMKFSNNNSTWTTAEPYATTKSWTLTSGSGTKTVYVKFKDASGNWSKVYSDTIVLDTTPPTGKISINNNAAKTNSTHVTLTLSASDSSGISQMQFSDNNLIWLTPEAYATTKSWTLLSGDGTKIVYVKFQDKAGNWSVVYLDTIVLDTTPPIISNVRAANIQATSAQINWDTNEPATAQVEYGLTTSYGYKSSLSSSLVTTRYITISSLKQYILYHYRVISKDNVGNQAISGDYTFTTKDTILPTGSIKINNGAASTNSINVTLNLSATDTGSGLSEMQFSNSSKSGWSTPEAYATTKSWTLTSGSGTKRVYVKFKDNAGNWSGAYSDSITLPNQTPQVGAITPSSGTSAPQETITFTTTYTDNNGWQDIKEAQFIINTTANGANCFYGYHNQNTNKLYLRNDSNTAWLGGYVPGSSYVIENSYAKLDCSKTTFSVSGITLTVKWAITFKSTFTGNKNTYLYVKDDANAYQDWVQKGTWTIQGPDLIPPTGTIKINNDAEYTKSNSVILNLSATDVGSGMGAGAEMRFSNDNINWPTPEAYAITKAWALNAGDGTKTVYVKFKDVAGNWSSAYSDAIILDTTKPSITITSPQNGAVITD